MQHKIVYHSSPDILWYITDQKNADIVLKRGISPEKFGNFDIPGINNGRAIYAVHMGDYDAAERIKAAAEIDDAVIVEFIAKSYYECIDETPEDTEEYEFLRTAGRIHQGGCMMPAKVKAKWIRSVTEM